MIRKKKMTPLKKSKINNENYLIWSDYLTTLGPEIVQLVFKQLENN